jgi:small subunit ribosomal protein S6
MPSLEILMSKYEMLLMFKPALEAESPDQAIAGVETLLKQHKARMLRVEKMGRKRLASPIKKQPEAFMAVMAFEGDPASIAPLNRILRLNEELLRFCLVKHETMDATKPFMLTPVTAKDVKEANRLRSKARADQRQSGGGGYRSRQPYGTQGAAASEAAPSEE